MSTDEGRPDDVRPEDAALMQRLGGVAALADPAPAALAGGAQAAFGLGRLDDELARLVQDTAGELVGARTLDAPRQLAFATDEVTVDVELTHEPVGHRLTGMVAGPVAAMTAQTPESTYDLTLDPHGRFRAGGIAGSLLRFVLTTEAGRGVTTPWVRLVAGNG